MDAVDPEIFARITRVPGSYERVLRGVRAAQAAGLGPVKINAVLLRGFNDNQIEDFARFSREENVIVRFIEYMPLEESSPDPERSMRGRRKSSSPWMRLLRDCSSSGRLSPCPPITPPRPPAASIPSTMVGARSALHCLGFLAVSAGHCSRVRLTVRTARSSTCLFSQSDHDLTGALMRRGGSDTDMAA